MVEMMHLAAQYLAAAAISFLDEKADDSHTNLEFDVEDGSLCSRPLNVRADKLALNYDLFSLDWHSKYNPGSLPLNEAIHSDIVDWIKMKASQSALDRPYEYLLHYELPYGIHEKFTFQLNDPTVLWKLKEQRITAQLAIETFLEHHHLTSEVRIWPHHFDTGAFTLIDDKSEFAIGLGLAIPDDQCSEYYFYLSAYHKHRGIDPVDFNPLENGEWGTGGYKGAILPYSLSEGGRVHDFFEEAFTIYRDAVIDLKK